MRDHTPEPEASSGNAPDGSELEESPPGMGGVEVESSWAPADKSEHQATSADDPEAQQ